MKTTGMTLEQLIEELENYDNTMKVKLFAESGYYSNVHGHVQFNTIRLSHEEPKSLQFAKDVSKPLFVPNEDMTIGILLSQIQRIIKGDSIITKDILNEYSVCKCDIGYLPMEVHDETMYLKNIKIKSEFESHSIINDGIDDTIFLEFKL